MDLGRSVGDQAGGTVGNLVGKKENTSASKVDQKPVTKKYNSWSEVLVVKNGLKSNGNQSHSIEIIPS